MTRRALHKKMRISLDPEYYRRKAIRMAKLQVYEVQNKPMIPTPPPPPPARKPATKQPESQIIVLGSTVVSFN
jgi:hypothetical protein